MVDPQTPGTGRPFRILAIVTFSTLLFSALTACGGGDDDDAETQPADTPSGNTGSDPDESGNDNAPSEAAASGKAGALTLGAEVIQLDRARCFLQEQPASAGGGKILFNAQGFGTTGEGAEFVLDISRYDEESQFTGDHIQVDVGDPRGADFYSWEVVADLGAVERDGSTLRAGSLAFRHSENGEEIDGAFEVNC